MSLTALYLLLASCGNDPVDPNPDTPTLDIDPTTEIVFNADGTGGVEAITVTTNQDEWNYTLTPDDGAGWLTVEKDGNKLNLTAAPNTETTTPESVTIKFTAGNAPEKTVTVKQKAAGEPELPDDGKYSVDDLWPDDENPLGIVFWIDPASSTDGGESGTAGWGMSLKQSSEYLSWCNIQVDESLNDFGTNSDIDGRLNMEAVWAYEAANADYAGSFDVFEWCRDTFGEQWYLPSVQELRRFCAVYMGLTPEQTQTYMNGRRLDNVNNILGDTGVWPGSEEHRRAYDMALIEAGGDGLWNWDTNSSGLVPVLWTSTKYDVDMPNVEIRPWYVEFLGGWGSASTDRQTYGNVARAMLRFGPETALDQLGVAPAELSFEASDTSVKTVTVTKTAAEYNATWAPAMGHPEWIHITKSADSFTVSVDEYTAAQAEINGFLERQGWITVVSGNAPAATVTVTQSAPAPPQALDLSGTWDWTGDIWEYGNYISMSGSVTAEYDEDLDLYIFKTLHENQAMTTLMSEDDRVDGGVALIVTEDNTVQFIVKKPLNIYFDLWNMGSMFRGYWNYATFFNASGGNAVEPTPSGLPADTAIGIGVSPDGNTLTFPPTGTYNDTEHTYGFGFGYMDIVSMEDHSISPNSSTIQPGGVYRNLVFTKVQ